jgi:heptaprenyl diphosphate synthase
MSETGNRDLTILILMATALGVIDSLIPRPLPFMKLGLANVATVIAVFRYGLLKALELNLLRAFAVALITGLLATPSFLLSVSGAVSSAIVMGGLLIVWPDRFSTIGISIAGAVLSLWTQLLAASVILGGLPLQNIVLLLTLWGIVSGALIGVLAQKALEKTSDTGALHKAEG